MAAVLAESDVADRNLACTLIENARDLRNTYVRHKDDLRSMGDDVCVEFKGGVARLYTQGREMISVPELREFGADYSKLNDYVAHGPVRTFSHSRLEVLFHAFR